VAKSTIGYCGLFCASCEIYIASTTSNERHKAKLAKRLAKELDKKITADDIHCWGCHANNRNCWGKKCFFRKCADDKGIDFCYQCHEYPCEQLAEFYEKHPDARENLTQVCKIGVDSYVSELINRNEKGGKKK